MEIINPDQVEFPGVNKAVDSLDIWIEADEVFIFPSVTLQIEGHNPR